MKMCVGKLRCKLDTYGINTKVKCLIPLYFYQNSKFFLYFAQYRKELMFDRIVNYPLYLQLLLQLFLSITSMKKYYC